MESSIQRDATLRAPYDGVIAERFVESNQNVSGAADRPFSDVDDRRGRGCPESVMADPRAGSCNRRRIQRRRAFVPVRVREIRPPTRHADVSRAGCPESPTGVNLLPGMTATVSLTYRRATILGGRILVPVSAIAKDDASAEQVAWVVGEDLTARAASSKSARQPEISSKSRRPATGGPVAVAGVVPA